MTTLSDTNALPSPAPSRPFPASIFRPHRFLRSGHAQTIFAAYRQPWAAPALPVSHTVSLDDGDAIMLHENCPAESRPTSPCVLLLHGVAGCHQSPYLVRIAHKLNQRGLRTFRMDLRGAGAGAHLARFPGHAGRSGDVAAAIEFVADRHPHSPQLVVGFSMGGNLVLKMLGELGQNLPGPVIGAAAVAPPIHLNQCSDNLNTGIARWYSRAFARMLLKQVRRRPAFADALDVLPQDRMPRTLWEFDDRLTAPLSGYASAEEYYQEASSIKVLSNIRCPTWILAARDDPLIPARIFPDSQPSDSIYYQETRYGGHVAYYGRSNDLDPDRWWMDWRIIDWAMHHVPEPWRE